MEIEKYLQSMPQATALFVKYQTQGNELECLTTIQQRYEYYLTLLDQLPAGVALTERIDVALDLLDTQKKALEVARAATEKQLYPMWRETLRAKMSWCAACSADSFPAALRGHRMFMVVNADNEMEVNEPELINIPELQCKCARWLQWLVKTHCCMYNNTRCALRIYPCVAKNCHTCDNQMHTTSLDTCFEEPLFTADNE
jgi:hypothetical protein